MKIIRIAIKDFLQSIRDIKLFLILTIMPILIICILGLAMATTFSSDSLTIENTVIEYIVKDDARGLSNEIENLFAEILGESSKLEMVESLEESLNRLRNNEITSTINIDGNTRVIKLYKNNIDNDKSSIIEGVMNGYIKRSNVISEVINKSPELLKSGVVDFSNQSHTKVRSITSNNTFVAMDYFGVSMCILFVFYSCSTPLLSIINEKKNTTLNRIFIANVSKFECLIGKVLGQFLSVLVQITIVFLTTLVAFNVNWGVNPFASYLLVVTLIFFAITMGTVLGLLVNNESIAVGILHGLIVIFAFFGGSYMPLVGLGVLSEVGKFFTPIWWNMNGLFDMIYYNNMETFYIAIAMNIGFSFIMILVSLLKFNQSGEMTNG